MLAHVMKYRDFALASSQTSNACREETLESRGEVSDEKKASRGKERRRVVENNKRAKGNGEAEMRRRRSRQERELMCLPDIRFQHLVCYSEHLRQTVEINTMVVLTEICCCFGQYKIMEVTQNDKQLR